MYSSLQLIVARGQNDALGSVVRTYSPDLFWQMAPVTFPDSCPAPAARRASRRRPRRLLSLGLEEGNFDEVGHGVLFEDGAAGWRSGSRRSPVQCGVGAHGHHAVGAVGLGHAENWFMQRSDSRNHSAHERLAAAVAAGGDPALHLQDLSNFRPRSSRREVIALVPPTPWPLSTASSTRMVLALFWGFSRDTRSSCRSTPPMTSTSVSTVWERSGRPRWAWASLRCAWQLPARLGQAGLSLAPGLRRASGQAERGHTGSTEGAPWSKLR